MSLESCIENLRALHEQEGVKSLSNAWLEQNGHKALYKRTLHLKRDMESVAKEFEVHQAWQQHQLSMRKANSRVANLAQGFVEPWTTDSVAGLVEEVVKKFGYIASETFLLDQPGGERYRGLTNAINRHGGLEYFKQRFNVIDQLRLYSRDHQKWRSSSESALANFFISYGIKPRQGKKYPDAYSVQSGRHAGYYDMHIAVSRGAFSGQELAIEVWGNGMSHHGGNAERYKETRVFKESFNADNPLFVGLEWTTCFNTKNLIEVFEKYIDTAAERVYVYATDRLIDPTKWSLADEIMVKVRNILTHIPNGLLPPPAWFKRKGKHADRQVGEWEDASWNSFIRDISSIGGMEYILEHLGQSKYSHLHERKTESELISEIQELYKATGLSPNAIATTLSSKQRSTEEDKLLKRTRHWMHLATKVFGSVRIACDQAQIFTHPYRRYDSKDAILQALQCFHSQHGKTPAGMKKALQQKGKISSCERDILEGAISLCEAAVRHFDCYAEALQLAGINNLKP